MTQYIVPTALSSMPDAAQTYVRWAVAPNVRLHPSKPNQWECALLSRDEIWDRSDDSLVIRPIEVPLGLFITETRKGKNRVLEGPNVSEVRRATRAKFREIGVRSQTALLPDIFVKLSRVAQVRQVMGPLHTALSTIRMRGELDPNTLVNREREREKWKAYLKFLTSAGYVRQGGIGFVAGRTFESILNEKGGPQAIPVALGRLLYDNFGYMTEVLGWRMMIPYLRWTSAYYWRALEAESLPSLDWDAWSSTYGLLYGKQTHGSPISQAQSLLEVEILREDGPRFVGTKDVFKPYQERARKDPVLTQVLSLGSAPSLGRN
ncbi:MAG: hypothetical protein M1126_04680 [Candidatus Thermoplasmatota archaeon]|jgi:hypothetical protein|nr:hypothetical protein [Candidatus Thermoplasmatota archaeon]